MKILHILDEIKYSGAEVMLKNSAYLFINKNFELHALSTGNNVGIYSSKLKTAGFKIHHIPFRKTLIFFIEISKLLVKEKFNVVHIHPERAFFWYSVIAKFSGTKSIVRTIHNVYTFEGYLRFKRKLQRFITNRFLNVIFISVSKSVKSVEKEFFNNETIIIKNWIDEFDLVPPKNEQEKLNAKKKLKLSLDNIIIVSIGNCSKVKNHYDVLKALTEVIKFITNITYLHVGEGESLSNEIKLAHELGISENVKFLGTADNIHEILICSDIFVMTSKYEGVGNTVLEAGSCELPLLLYDSHGLRELVIDNYNGFLLKQDYKFLIDGLKRLASNKELRKTMGRNARKFVLENYSMLDSVNKLIEIYFK